MLRALELACQTELGQGADLALTKADPAAHDRLELEHCMGNGRSMPDEQ